MTVRENVENSIRSSRILEIVEEVGILEIFEIRENYKIEYRDKIGIKLE